MSAIERSTIHDSFFESTDVASRIKSYLPMFISRGNAIQGRIDGGGYCNTNLKCYIESFFTQIGSMTALIDSDETVLLDKEMKDNYKELKQITKKLKVKLNEITPFSLYNLVSKKTMAIAVPLIIGLGAILGFKYFPRNARTIQSASMLANGGQMYLCANQDVATLGAPLGLPHALMPLLEPHVHVVLPEAGEHGELNVTPQPTMRENTDRQRRFIERQNHFPDSFEGTPRNNPAGYWV